MPIGWFRRALNVEKKYEDGKIWLGCINAEEEWPVALHGTHKDAVSGITRDGLAFSAVKRDAIMEEANCPGLYVATHCNGGCHPQYTSSCAVPILSNENEQFRIVFQYRVQPRKFTTHTRPVSVGEAWHIVDPKAVRTYGILLKKEEPTERDAET